MVRSLLNAPSFDHCFCLLCTESARPAIIIIGYISFFLNQMVSSLCNRRSQTSLAFPLLQMDIIKVSRSKRRGLALATMRYRIPDYVPSSY
jgi:hypothetical protein